MLKYLALIFSFIFLANKSFAGAMTDITTAVDVSAVTTALFAVGALMVVPVVAKWGIRKLLGFFG